MNQSFQDARRIQTLFEALLEGSLTPAETEELDALLIGDPRVRRRYVEYVQLHASLADFAQGPLSPADVSTEHQPPVPARLAPPVAPTAAAKAPLDSPLVTPPPAFPWTMGFGSANPLFGALLAGVVFVGGTALGLYYRGNLQVAEAPPADLAARPKNARPQAEPAPAVDISIDRHATTNAVTDVALSQAASFATLVKVSGCKWGACTLPTQTGSRLTSGLFRLDSGKAQITFDNGARLNMQGPAVLYLYGPSRTHLRSGKLVAHVPEQAIGFTIETQKAEIVDLGTEFGVSVAPTGDTEVQVLDGEVEVGAAPAPANPQNWLHDPEDSQVDSAESVRRRLPVGEARRIGSASGEWSQVEFTPDVYRMLRPRMQSTPVSPWRRVLTDDFDDNFLDQGKWQVKTDGVPQGTPQVREVDGRIVFVDRGRLVTLNEYDPVRCEGLRITGQWTFQTPDEMFEVVLRTDAAAGGNEGGVMHGVHFAARMERTTSHIGIFGTGRLEDVASAFGDILINPGDVFNFEILDLPGGMSLRLWEASGSGAEAHVHTRAPRSADNNYVVFHNRNRRKATQIAYLDNVVIEQGNGNVRMTPDGLIEVKK